MNADQPHLAPSSHARMSIEWLVTPGQARPITTALQLLAADTRTARGCTSCSMSTELTSGVTVRYVEEWETEDDLRHHLRSDIFRRLAPLIEDAQRTPSVVFVVGGETRGLDYIGDIQRSQD